MYYLAVSIQIFTLITIFILAVYSFHKRNFPEFKAFFLLCINVSGWVLLALANWVIDDPDTLIWISRFEYIFISLTPVLILIFALTYSQQSKYLQKKYLIGMLVFPAITVIAVFTNPVHHLFFVEHEFFLVFEAVIRDSVMGPLFYFMVSYSYIFISIGIWQILQVTLRSLRYFKVQSILLLLGIVTPFFVNFIYLSFFLRIIHVDITPLSFTFASAAIGWGLYKSRQVGLMPIVKDLILDQIQDGIIVINKFDQVLELNHQAELLLGVSSQKAIGLSIKDILVLNNRDYKILASRKSTSLEIELKINDVIKDFELCKTTIKDNSGNELGELVTLHEITERKQYEDVLNQRDTVFEAINIASQDLLKLTDWDKGIQTSIAHLGQACKAEKVMIIRASFDDLGERIGEVLFEWPDEQSHALDRDIGYRLFTFAESNLPNWESVMMGKNSIRYDLSESTENKLNLFSTQLKNGYFISVPIFVNDKWWGAVGFIVDPKTNEMLNALEDVFTMSADIIGASLERMEIENSLKRYTNRIQGLRELDQQIISTDSLTKIALSALNSLKKQVDSYFAEVLIKNSEMKRIQKLACLQVDRVQSSNSRLKIENVRFPEKIQTVNLSQLQSGKNGEKYFEHDQWLMEKGVLIYICVPLCFLEKEIGVLNIGFQNFDLTDEEIDIIDEIGSSLSIGLHNALLLQESKKKAYESEVLRQAGAVVSASLKKEDIFERILEQLESVIPFDSAAIQLLMDGYVEIISQRGVSFSEENLGKRFSIPGKNPNTEVILNRTPVISGNVREDYDSFNDTVINSYLGVPLEYQGKIIGMMTMAKTEKDFYQGDHLRLVEAFASHVSIAIENVNLFNEIQQLAITDQATGLYNRRHFFNLAENEFERAKRYLHPLSIIMMDFDHFKDINDTYGHSSGDQVLCDVAQRARSSLREVDIMARYGGEEFLILLPETEIQEACDVAERLRLIICSEPFLVAGKQIQVSVSLGVAGYEHKNVEGFQELVDFADKAMYRAKNAGRNRVFLIGE